MCDKAVNRGFFVFDSVPDFGIKPKKCLTELFINMKLKNA